MGSQSHQFIDKISVQGFRILQLLMEVLDGALGLFPFPICRALTLVDYQQASIVMMPTNMSPGIKLSLVIRPQVWGHAFGIW